MWGSIFTSPKMYAAMLVQIQGLYFETVANNLAIAKKIFSDVEKLLSPGSEFSNKCPKMVPYLSENVCSNAGTNVAIVF